MRDDTRATFAYLDFGLRHGVADSDCVTSGSAAPAFTEETYRGFGLRFCIQNPLSVPRNLLNRAEA